MNLSLLINVEDDLDVTCAGTNVNTYHVLCPIAKDHTIQKDQSRRVRIMSHLANLRNMQKMEKHAYQFRSV